MQWGGYSGILGCHPPGRGLCSWEFAPETQVVSEKCPKPLWQPRYAKMAPSHSWDSWLGPPLGHQPQDFCSLLYDLQVAGTSHHMAVGFKQQTFQEHKESWCGSLKIWIWEFYSSAVAAFYWARQGQAQLERKSNWLLSSPERMVKSRWAPVLQHTGCLTLSGANAS